MLSLEVQRVVFAKANYPLEVVLLLCMHKYSPAGTGSLTQPCACGTTFVCVEYRN